jgi:hypothetical protein
MKRPDNSRHPWWSVEKAASYLGIRTSDLRELSAAGTGPRYTEDLEAIRHYRPADVRLWASTGSVRDSRGWNGATR